MINNLPLYICLLITFIFSPEIYTNKTIPADLSKNKDITRIDIDEYLTPAFFLTGAQKIDLSSLVKDNKPAKQQFNKVKQKADEALHAKPQPVKQINYEGLLEHDPARVETKKALFDMPRIKCLTYAWIVTGEKVYAEKAKDFILEWTNVLESSGNPINMNKITTLIFAYDGLKPRFSKDEQSQIEKWMLDLAGKQKTSSIGKKADNWQSKRIKLVGMIGVALNDSLLIEFAVKGFKKYVEEGLRPDGTSVDLERRDALDYHVSGLNPLLELAIALQGKGYDVYRWEGKNGAALYKSVRYVLPYARGEKEHEEFAESKVDFDRKRAESGYEKYRAGHIWEPDKAIGFYELAMVFEDEFKDLIISYKGQKNEEEFPTWETVVAEAVKKSNSNLLSPSDTRIWRNDPNGKQRPPHDSEFYYGP